MREYIKKIMKAWHAGKASADSGCGNYCGRTKSMSLRGNVIYSYYTPLAVIVGGVMYLNRDKYSATTSRQQSGLAYCASRDYGLRVVDCTESELAAMINR